MRAVRFDRYGDIDELRVEEVPTPTATEGRVVVAVRATGINPGEAGIRVGALHDRWPATFPSGQGSDLAGVVHTVGAGTSLQVGDEVLGWTDERAAQAEYVSVPAGQLIPKPPAVPWEVAGSLLVAGGAAWSSVHAIGAAEGQTVVVSGAAGGVGTIAVQLLLARGVHVVGIASAHNHPWLASLGAVPVAYGDDLVADLHAAAPGGIDGWADLFGGGYVQTAISLGVAPEHINTIFDFEAAQAHPGVQVKGTADAPEPQALTELAEMVADGRLLVPIAAAYPLEQVQAAYAELEKRHTHGKIVLLP